MNEATSEADPKRAGFGPGRERMILLILAAVQFTSIVDFMIVMPLGPDLMEALEIGPGRFGMIVSSYTFAAGAAGLVATSLIDRFGRKAAFLWLFAGFLVGTLLCGLAPGYASLVAARILTGAFGGVLGGMAMAIVGDVFPDERRGRATGILMSAFALASVAGVPIGLHLGTSHGWHVPFVVLAALGCPVFAAAAAVLPPLRGHLTRREDTHPLRSVVETFADANHQRAFALIVVLMFGGFAVIPYISAYLVANVGVSRDDLPLVYVAGGALTLIGAPLTGRLADRFGKLRVYRVVAPVSAALMFAVTVLPPVSLWVAVAVVAGIMVANAGRMVPAMAMVIASVTPARRGGFLSANSSVQHLAAGLGSSLGAWLIVKPEEGPLQNFWEVGVVAAASTLVSLWLAGRLRVADGAAATAAALSLAAAAEATCDAGEPLADAGTC